MRAHVCSACGGTGGNLEGLRSTSAVIVAAALCPVCQGSGRISDVRTARDAMVDAETLRIVAAEQYRSRTFRALLEAHTKGHLATGWERQEDTGRYRGFPFSDLAASFAKVAARAAFRAVPALRGE